MAMIANITKSAESVKHASEVSYKLSNNGKNGELESFFSDIEKLVKETEDPVETIIGVISYCKQTVEGKDMGGFTDPPAVAEEAKVPEEDDDEYPELMEEESEGLSAVERLELEFRDKLGDKFADAFLERMESVYPDKETEMCSQYAKILNTINGTYNEMEESPKGEYLWMAEEMLKNMENGFLYAPLAYKVLGELVKKDVESAEEFIWKTIEAETSEKLADICRNSKSD